MQLRKLLLPGLLSVTLLSGCSLFSGEEDVVKMSPLPTVENQFTPSTAWDTSVGDGIGDFYSNLHPAFAEKKCGPLTWRKKTAGSPVNLRCFLAA